MNSPCVQLTIGCGQHNATYLFGLWPHCAYRVPFLGIPDQTNKEQKAIIFVWSSWQTFARQQDHNEHFANGSLGGFFRWFFVVVFGSPFSRAAPGLHPAKVPNAASRRPGLLRNWMLVVNFVISITSN